MLKFTKELANEMKPDSNQVYGSYSLPSLSTKDEVTWNDPDQQFVITLDRKTKVLTGEYYEWLEEDQDWVDVKEMDEGEIHREIISNNLVIA